MKSSIFILLAIFALTPATSLQAQDLLSEGRAARSESWKRKLWKGSLALLATATVVDAHSSWGGRELNPVLRGPDGRFGTQAVAIKAGLALAVAGGQYFTMKRMDKGYGSTVGTSKAYTAFTISNLAGAAVLGAAAAHNYRVR